MSQYEEETFQIQFWTHFDKFAPVHQSWCIYRATPPNPSGFGSEKWILRELMLQLWILLLYALNSNSIV
ncbi:unnamed protein product [Cuscuta campestris]|uniref:Uncharacterized protein n=1 Tax=Cuscuta campestris TaxID=132261 RepID=A0A484NFD2_9ASTE|nr:unnamed protein product [Cuscuta campestris]